MSESRVMTKEQLKQRKAENKARVDKKMHDFFEKKEGTFEIGKDDKEDNR